jgi:predicted amidophosphoribosyltransferase
MSVPDPAAVLLRARQRLTSVSAEQPCRTPQVACATCTAPVDAYTYCVHCQRHRNSQYGHALADLVVPLAYAWEGQSQLGKDVYTYKRDTGLRAASAFGNLAALVWTFSALHAQCPGRQLDAPLTALAVTPSLRGNAGLSLAKLAVLLPKAWRTIPLQPSANYGDAGRTLNPAHFRIPDPAPARSAHVLLLDDTWVTGGHSQSAAIALTAAGAAQVTILPICRLLEWRWPANEIYRASPHRRAWSADTGPVTGGPCPTSP